MMTKLLKFLFVIGFIFVADSTSFAQKNHVGLWKGVDQGDVGYINMDSAGFAYFVFKNDTLGGESFTMNGLEAYMKYEVDYTKSLKTMDFIIYLKINNLEFGRLPGIFKFDKKDRLILCLNFEGKKRPNTFIEGNTIQLEKIDAMSNKK